MLTILMLIPRFCAADDATDTALWAAGMIPWMDSSTVTDRPRACLALACVPSGMVCSSSTSAPDEGSRSLQGGEVGALVQLVVAPAAGAPAAVAGAVCWQVGSQGRHTSLHWSPQALCKGVSAFTKEELESPLSMQ